MINPINSPEAGFDRRFFLYRVSSFTPMLFLGGLLANTGLGNVITKDAAKDEVESTTFGVSPTEDLMREHGILKRVILIYREFLRRMDAGDDSAFEPTADAAQIIRTFIEDYHEKLEEDFLFPRFHRAGLLVELVDTLKAQHQAGRRVTDIILLANDHSFHHDAANQARLKDAILSFIRMYEPHAAREDTVLFPAIHQIVKADEYDDLAEQFEDKEHELFGENGFEKMVERVAALEKSLQIYELSQFTPK